MSIQLYSFRVQGISPLLMHNPIGMSRPSEDVKAKTIPAPEEEAERAVYRSSNGVLYYPGAGFKSSLLGGCSGKRIGKRAASGLMQAGVFEADLEVPLFDPQSDKPITEYVVHTARAVVMRNGVIRARAMVPSWAANVVFEVDDDFVSAEQVLTIFNFAGRIAGVGDWRPNKKGRFGRYFVASVEAAANPVPQKKAA